MDTDFLTQLAYEILIGHSGRISGILRAEVGAAANRYPNEDNLNRAFARSGTPEVQR